MNNCAFVGRLGKKPELRRTPGGTSVTNFSLALDNRPRRGEQEKPPPTWINCVAWGKTAEVVERYLDKGSQAAVVTHVENRTWEDRNGQRQVRTEFIVDKLTFVGGGQKAQQQERREAETQQEQYPADWDLPQDSGDNGW